MNQSMYVGVDGAPIGAAPSATCCANQRAVVTATAGPLGGFITAVGDAQSGIPYYLAPAMPGPNNKIFPKAVNLQIEAGQTTYIYMTDDGHTISLGDVSATLGMNIIPVAPAWIRVPVDCNPTAGYDATGRIRLKSSSGTTNVQCRFEW